MYTTGHKGFPSIWKICHYFHSVVAWTWNINYLPSCELIRFMIKKVTILQYWCRPYNSARNRLQGRFTRQANLHLEKTLETNPPYYMYHELKRSLFCIHFPPCTSPEKLLSKYPFSRGFRSTESCSCTVILRRRMCERRRLLIAFCPIE